MEEPQWVKRYLEYGIDLESASQLYLHTGAFWRILDDMAGSHGGSASRHQANVVLQHYNGSTEEYINTHELLQSTPRGKSIVTRLNLLHKLACTIREITSKDCGVRGLAARELFEFLNFGFGGFREAYRLAFSGKGKHLDKLEVLRMCVLRMHTICEGKEHNDNRFLRSTWRKLDEADKKLFSNASLPGNEAANPNLNPGSQRSSLRTILSLILTLTWLAQFLFPLVRLGLYQGTNYIKFGGTVRAPLSHHQDAHHQVPLTALSGFLL